MLGYRNFYIKLLKLGNAAMSVLANKCYVCFVQGDSIKYFLDSVERIGQMVRVSFNFFINCLYTHAILRPGCLREVHVTCLRTYLRLLPDLYTVATFILFIPSTPKISIKSYYIFQNLTFITPTQQ